MTPHAIETGDIHGKHLEALVAARTALAEMPDGLDCHEVCARLAALLKVSHARGKFNGYEHSWLALPGGVILDPYPWASASGPLLIVGWAMMWRDLYVEAEGAAHGG